MSVTLPDGTVITTPTDGWLDHHQGFELAEFIPDQGLNGVIKYISGGGVDEEVTLIAGPLDYEAHDANAPGPGYVIPGTVPVVPVAPQQPVVPVVPAQPQQPVIPVIPQLPGIPVTPVVPVIPLPGEPCIEVPGDTPMTPAPEPSFCFMVGSVILAVALWQRIWRRPC